MGQKAGRSETSAACGQYLPNFDQQPLSMMPSVQVAQRTMPAVGDAVTLLPFRSRSAALATLGVIALFAALKLAGTAVPWATVYPEKWILPVDRWLGSAVKWLIKDAALGPIGFKDATRAIGATLEAPMLLLKGLLASGFTFKTAGGEMLLLPPLSWISVGGCFVLMALAIGERRLAVFVGLSFLYVALMGLWESTMLTFASIVAAVGIGVLLGTLLGAAAYRWRPVDAFLAPVFDFMQTMPVFAYLVPALMLFGYGPAAALVVTLIYAMPPMARVTRLALSQASPEILEFSRMVGCTRRQQMWKVLLPSVRPRLMIGVNQVIMLSLNMVIIASMIGAGGLGYDVWQALKALRIGEGAEAGIAITLVAIVLDRISQRYATRRPVGEAGQPAVARRHRYLVAGAVLVIALTVLQHWLPALGRLPETMTLSTGRFWDDVIDWANLNLYGYINVVRDFFFIYALKPVKAFMLALPWLGVVGLLAAVGVALGGFRLALKVALLTSFIAVVGLWEKAMISVYLVSICVVISCAIGIPIGILAAFSDRVHQVTGVVIDTLQTLPSFVYLIPVIMLFSVGDFSAMIAVVLYAVVPAIRYTDHGLRNVPAGAVEAARSMGCTRRQILRLVLLPLALPDIMLGVNQTIMMGLSMLVITALVGTRDLGQETLIALSKADPGHGVVAGMCVAFIAIAADRLINAWARRRKKELGLDAVGIG